MNGSTWEELIAELEAVTERLGICGEANLAQIATLLRRRELIVREVAERIDRGSWPEAAGEPVQEALAGGVTLASKLRAAAADCRGQLRDLYRELVMAQALQIGEPCGPQEIDCHG